MNCTEKECIMMLSVVQSVGEGSFHRKLQNKNTCNITRGISVTESIHVIIKTLHTEYRKDKLEFLRF